MFHHLNTRELNFELTHLITAVLDPRLRIFNLAETKASAADCRIPSATRVLEKKSSCRSEAEFRRILVVSVSRLSALIPADGGIQLSVAISSPIMAT